MRALNWIAFLFLISLISNGLVYAADEQTESLQVVTGNSDKEMTTKEASSKSSSKKRSRRHHSKSKSTTEVSNENSEKVVDSGKRAISRSGENYDDEVEQEDFSEKESFGLVFPRVSLRWFPKVIMYLSGRDKRNQSRLFKFQDFRGWLDIPIIPDLVETWNSLIGDGELEQEEEGTEDESPEAAEEDQGEDNNDGADEDIPLIPTIPVSNDDNESSDDSGFDVQSTVNNVGLGASTFVQPNVVPVNSNADRDNLEIKKLSEENNSLKQQTNDLQNTIAKLRRKYLKLRERSVSDIDINLGDAEAVRRAMQKLKAKRLLLNYPLGTCAVCNRTLAPLSTLIPNSNSGICVYCANRAVHSAGHNREYDLLFGGNSSNGYSSTDSQFFNNSLNNGINGHSGSGSQFADNYLNNGSGRNGGASGGPDFDQNFLDSESSSSLFGEGSGGGGLMGNLLGTALSGVSQALNKKGGIAGLLSGDDKDSNNTVSSDTMVFDANGKLVPLSSLEGTSAKYGYVMNANGIWVPASSLAEGIAAPNSTYVLDANGNKVLLSSMANTSTPYGYVRNPDGTLSPATTLAQGTQAAAGAVGAGMMGVGANQMVYNANGQLVPLSSLAGTNAPYGYVRNPDGTLSPATTLAQGTQAAAATANKKVFDATGKLVPISSLTGSNAPYGYVMKDGVWVPASSEAEGLDAVNSTYVLDASGNKVLLSSMAGTSTPFGYVRNADGTLAPATSVTQAVKSAASSPTAISKVNNAVNTASNIANTALTSATTLATTLAALKSIAPARDPNSSGSGLFNRSGSNSNSANSQASDQAKEKARLEKRYKDLELQVRRQENTVQKNQTALDKAKQILEEAKTALQNAQQKVSAATTDSAKRRAQKSVESAQNNINMKQNNFDKSQQTLDSSKQRLEELKTEYQEAQSAYQKTIGM